MKLNNFSELALKAPEIKHTINDMPVMNNFLQVNSDCTSDISSELLKEITLIDVISKNINDKEISKSMHNISKDLFSLVEKLNDQRDVFDYCSSDN